MTIVPENNLNSCAKIAGIAAIKAWHLEAKTIELISEGENLVYQLDTIDGQRYALRVHRPGYHSVKALESEQIWTSALNEAGISVPIGQPKPDGTYYQPMPVLDKDDIRQIGLVGWLEGESLHELVSKESNSQNLVGYIEKIGAIAAAIHNQASGWQAPTGFVRHHLDAEGFMGDTPFWGPFWTLPELSSEESTLFLEVREALFEYLSRLDKSQDNYSILHADLHGGNLLVSDEGITVIDFDDAGYGWHPYELAVALFHFQDHPQFADIRHHLITGYRSVRAIDQTRLNQIDVFLLIRALAAIGWCHQRRETDRSEYLASLIQRAVLQSKQFLNDT